MQMQAMDMTTHAGFQAHGERMEHLEARLYELCTDLIPQPRIRHRLENRVVERKEQSGSANNGEEESSEYHLSRARQRPSKRARCTCGSSRSQQKWRITGLVRLQNESAAGHLPSCPCFKSNTSTSRLRIDLDLLWLWRSHGTSMTLDIVRGARGSVLSCSLTCRRIMPVDSPAFKMLDIVNHRTLSIPVVRKRLDEMFRSGEAFPGDESSTFGESLLHVSVALRIVQYESTQKHGSICCHQAHSCRKGANIVQLAQSCTYVSTAL